jgi:glycosyltransferase involved in cell wall biosynthesis
VVAAIDADTAIPNLLRASGAGVAVPPDDQSAFVEALRRYLDDPILAAAAGSAGREWAVANASPAAVGAAYARLLSDVAGA